ncbi:hypothetical protein BKA62DRAFT_595724, partial [Auriculariales sp. MPI-PUGE-AT-0066]
NLLLLQIRKLAVKVNNSPTVLLPLWETKCGLVKLKHVRLRQDVTTRWNSMYDAGIRALEYRGAIDAITGDRTAGLREFRLDDEEWDLLEDLLDLLKVFKDATLYFSRESTSIADVIPAMDHIDSVLANAMENTTISTALRGCANLSRRVMNRYYSLTDATPAYRIAM